MWIAIGALIGIPLGIAILAYAFDQYLGHLMGGR